MAVEFDHRWLWLGTAPKMAALVAVFGLLVASPVGTQPVFVTELASRSRPIRAAIIAFVGVCRIWSPEAEENPEAYGRITYGLAALALLMTIVFPAQLLG